MAALAVHGLNHLSWAEIVSAAVLQRVHRGVSDPEQAWILVELIRYLEHPGSGARDLGSGVQVALSRKEQGDITIRQQALATELVQHGSLSGALRVPHTVGDIQIVADIRTGRCSTSVDVAAPGDGRPLTRINWLVRQLADAPDSLRLDAYALNARTSTSELLRSVKANSAVLVSDPRADLRRFRITATSQLGTKRGIGRGSFIDSVLGAVDGFYATVLQGIRPWVQKAPQLPRTGSAVSDAGIDTTVLPDEQSFIDEEPADELATASQQPAAVSKVATSEDGDVLEAVGGPGAGDNFVSWAVQERELQNERLEGHAPANGDGTIEPDDSHHRASPEASCVDADGETSRGSVASVSGAG